MPKVTAYIFARSYEQIARLAILFCIIAIINTGIALSVDYNTPNSPLVFLVLLL
ncbi:metal ABC transporter permease [Candidatus Ishikawella capsulata]|uniref:metal ABC transporter permease n=1 Tax=Candidatus Ishikawella capsulata TaxID=168169 RepID=UPI00387E715C